MADAYPTTPVDVGRIATTYRTIRSAIPHPESVPVIEALRQAEPWCMEGQPPIVWERAEGTTVYDGYGNRWIDFTSGVLITNAGHAPSSMVEAMVEVTESPLLTSYCFPHQRRAELTTMLQRCATRDDDKVMLLSTGSEAIELAIKLCREHHRNSDRSARAVFVTFGNAFHGRTLGSQQAGGVQDLKQWIGYHDDHFVQVPFPDGVRSAPEDLRFDAFLRHLDEQGISAKEVCGVMTETYQGGDSCFAPLDYMQALRQWCDEHGIVLVMDEVQAGFGRTGRFWGFEHYGIEADLIVCGKGISGSLPLSAVIGRQSLMDQFPPGSMTSTHSGNPLCCAAAIASLKVILEQNLAQRAATVGRIMQDAAHHIAERFSDCILAHQGRGMVASLLCVEPGSRQPDPKLAWEVVGRAVQTGVMLFAPVGYMGSSVKLSPPLTIDEAALREGMEAVEEAFAHVLAQRGAIGVAP